MPSMPAKPLGDVKAALEKETEQVVSHPAMAILARFLNAEDQVSFKAAHLFKRQLDEAMKTPVGE